MSDRIRGIAFQSDDFGDIIAGLGEKAVNLFITHQVRSGRYTELWGKYVGGEAPELRIPGVFY